MENRAETERLISALKSAEIMVWEWELATGAVFTAGSLMENMGLPQPSSIEDFFSLLHPADRDSVTVTYEKARTDGQLNDIEFRVAGPDGAAFWLNDRGKWELNSAGAPVKYSGALRDVTKQKLILDSFLDLIPRMTFVASARGQVEYRNAAWREFAGIGPGGGGDAWHSIAHPAERPAAIAAWAESLRTGRNLLMECRLRRADGSYVWHIVTAMAMRKASGEIHQWFGSCTDINQQKTTEIALRRSNEDLEQFAYIASHDLQEPLRTVASFSQLLLRNYKGRLDADADQYLNWLGEAANRMSDLILGLLNYYSERQLQTRVGGAVDCREALMAAQRELAELIEEKNATITHEAMPVVPGFNGQLVQVFTNLVGNAVKYSKPQEPPRIHVSAQRNRSAWIFAVQDNGVGFDSVHAQKIFGIFRRLHGPDVPGTGIGLAICKAIIERHGGHIWAESQPGLGSTFRFTLPAEPEEQA